MSKLEGKVALVTGGNSGIGLATAKQFVNEGAYVFITGRRESELAAAVKEVGRNITAVRGDVSNLDDLDRLFSQIKREKGRLDIVFANAGVAKLAPLGTITEEFYDSIFNVNVKGLLFTVQKALPLLPEGASIILNAAIGASKGLGAGSVSSATKAAVRSFARTWTTDLKQRRIRVNAVSPGLTDTPGFNDVLASPGAGSARPLRSPGQSFFSLPTTAATLRGRSCLWMAASHRCRPSLVGELFMVCGSAGGRVLRRLRQPTGTLPAPGRSRTPASRVRGRSAGRIRSNRSCPRTAWPRAARLRETLARPRRDMARCRGPSSHRSMVKSSCLVDGTTVSSITGGLIHAEAQADIFRFPRRTRRTGAPCALDRRYPIRG